MKYNVWYMTPDFFPFGVMGKLPYTSERLSETHTFVKEVEAEHLDDVFLAMQAERWSPNGEARSLIESKGLQHTSMTVGDAIVTDSKELWVVSSRGFQQLVVGDRFLA